MIAQRPPTTADRLAASYCRMRQRVSLWCDTPPTSNSSAVARWKLLMAAANELAEVLAAHCEPDDLAT